MVLPSDSMNFPTQFSVLICVIPLGYKYGSPPRMPREEYGLFNTGLIMPSALTIILTACWVRFILD